MDSHPPKPLILLVDDDAGILTLLNQGLSQMGYVCRTCANGKDAVDLLARERFDAVISDLQMPGLSGLDVLAEVKKKYPYLAFLMVTGVDDINVGIQAMKQGAHDYLVKPLALEAVAASLSRALEAKRLELEVQAYRERLEEMVAQRTKQLQAATKRIELTYDDTLQALGAALDLRDNETAGHSRRVTRCCLEMAKAMDCPEDQLKQIERGAYLHDIGKIGIPDSILLKPGKLTVEEREVMETHARIGYELVSRVSFLAPAAEIVLAHQERFDGTGYPQGLVGDEIPLGARIFAVADTLDAMTSDRPYRRALPFETARAEIERESGRQFDPRVVAVFLEIPEPAWALIRQDAEGVRSKLGVSPSQQSPEIRLRSKG